ncbi:MAG: xanthine dehydrogenase family protein molybdopterin-binding subunit [Rhodospirillales bacterium]|jgi:xanthine dehydrogenase molybdenum-binding subunit|nr:xanthine dehydrogenase family protein molybdopterin-binding subunit [Rhodospirillales bacterium]MDP6841469.1 xanthine dehydrogenase family protein molybdopterin-binding subunit [Rhodospirillales bacterium]
MMDQIAEQETLIGQRIPKPDGPDKVLGRTQYINDMVLHRMLIGKILRTDRVHARILSIDTSKAAALPGVHAVITGDDTPMIGIGVNKDNPPLKGDKVRCIRDEIAAVAAETEEIADQALALIQVQYEDLAAVFDPAEALRDDAPQLHDDKPGNVGLSYNISYGDIAAGEQESDVVLDETYELHYVTHCCMGPGCVIAEFDPAGKLTIYSQTQYPYNFKMDLAPTLGIHPGDIRVIQPAVGGAFGSKLDVYPFEPICAFLAKKTRRPVKLVFSREEEFIASPTRQPVRAHIRAGARKDGTLTFRDVNCLLNNGGYTSWGATVPFVMMRTFSGHFRVPNVECKSTAVYTNNPFAGSFRGYGNVQATYVTATLMDKLAEAVGMDPITFRLKNAQEPGEVTPQGSLLKDCALADCIKIAAEKTDFLARHGANTEARDNGGRYRKGIGIATSIHNAGGAKIHKSDGCGTILTMDDYARVTVITGASEIGQGIDAVITQIVAEELGVPLSDITIHNNDSAIGPWDVGVHASRTTFIAGNGAKRAAIKAKAQILVAAAHQANVDASELDLRAGHVIQADNGVSIVRLDRLLRAMHFAGEDAELVMVTDYYEPPSVPEVENHYGDMSAAYAHAAYVAEVEVDTMTGHVKVEKMTVVQDVGRVVNELGIEGQIEGGIAMSIGFGLSEDLKIEDGIVKNPSFRDYKVVTAPEMPAIEYHFIENDEPEGPFGAKGIAELPAIVPAPAIANAVYNAIGVRFDNPPITPEKVAMALHGGPPKK